MLNIAQADVLNKFKSLEPKDINVDLFYDDNQIMVDFPLNDEFDLVIYLNSDVSTPDDYSILCEGTKYNKAVYASQYDSDLDEECNVDLSFMLEHIENFIVSDDFKIKEEVFFESSDLESSWEVEKEYNNPMKTYGLSNSDFI
ncbi:Hypothetical protein DAL_134 [Psychrobacter phage D'Alembert]|nr:Hypothetical protein DAL_134 [Psychrobacter phage D'Alembert]